VEENERLALVMKEVSNKCRVVVDIKADLGERMEKVL